MAARRCGSSRVPTPGQANNEGYLGEVAPLRFSHERGFYSSPFDVTIRRRRKMPGSSTRWMGMPRMRYR